MKIKYKVTLYTSEIPYDEPIDDVEFDVDVTIPFNYNEKESYEVANIIARELPYNEYNVRTKIEVKKIEHTQDNVFASTEVNGKRATEEFLLAIKGRTIEFEVERRKYLKRALLQLISDTSNLFLSISYGLKHFVKRTVARIVDNFFTTDRADIAANVARETEKEKALRLFEKSAKKLSTMEEKLSELESEVKELLIGNRRALKTLVGDDRDDKGIVREDR